MLFRHWEFGLLIDARVKETGDKVLAVNTNCAFYILRTYNLL